MNDENETDGAESPNVELIDRTGELFDTENINWYSSAVYDHQPIIENHEAEKLPVQHSGLNDHVWSVADDLTRRTQEFLHDDTQVSPINN